MKSSNLMTLFSEQPRPSTGPSAFMVSIVVHVVAFVFLFSALKHAPQINITPEVERYTVRLLKAPRVEPVQRSLRSSQLQAVRHASAHDSSAGGGASAPSPAAQLPQLPARSQTLVQPDAPTDRLLQQETPVPLVMMWSPENSPSKVIVAPPQQEATIVETRPTLIKPNREPNLADINITMTPFPSRTPILPPGSTSPIVVRGPEAVKQMPSTSSVELEPPSPARVLSIAPIQAEGPVVIPFVNAASQPNSSALVISPVADKASGNGNGNHSSAQSGTGPADGRGSAKNNGGAATGSVLQTRAATEQDGGSAAGLAPGGEFSMTHISVPKDGQFGVVVVGSSLVDQYPAIGGIWGSRLVYTVYLHVGTGKNWILQYSLPRTEEAATGGDISRPEAPWPYDILRPHLNPADYNSDAVMVHGFVNMAGRFERLALVFPAGFTQAKFVLDALQQWQFRPARRNGQIAAVEILLIIPEETE